jgi:hypothetical protein
MVSVDVAALAPIGVAVVGLRLHEVFLGKPEQTKLPC